MFQRFLKSLKALCSGSSRSRLTDVKVKIQEDHWMFDDNRYCHLEQTGQLSKAALASQKTTSSSMTRGLDDLRAAIKRTSQSATRFNETNLLAQELFERELAQPMFTGSREAIGRTGANVKSVLFGHPVDNDVLFDETVALEDDFLWSDVTVGAGRMMAARKSSTERMQLEVLN